MGQRIHEVVFNAGSKIGVLALHADIEGGTGELAKLIAAEINASMLTFCQPDAYSIRVPSADFRVETYPELGLFLESVDFVLSLHGHTRDGRLQDSILLGGKNRSFAALTGQGLRSHGHGHLVVDELADIPASLRGLHPDNPVNLARCGGVQAELSVSARGCQPMGRPNKPALPSHQIAAGFVDGLRRIERVLDETRSGRD